MSQKIVVGPINKGIRSDRTAFVIDNDSFPTLINAYQWRGRIRRKRGTSLLNRLRRTLSLSSIGNISSGGAGTSVVNLFTALGITGENNAQIELASLTAISIVIGAPISQTLSANTATSTLTITGAGPITAASLNYATGALTLTFSGAAGASAATFSGAYYPDLPVMGLEPLVLPSSQFPLTLAFDTKYSYNIGTTSPYTIYNTNFYNNPVTGAYTGYTQKSTWTTLNWNGQDYQQFWTTNYQGALWATNGVEVPFDPTNVGMQYKPIVTTTIVAGGPPARVTLQITGHGLVVGDFVFVNEVATTTGINFQTGYVDTVTDPNNVIVTFPNATIATNGTGGIAQYLTRSADSTKDCIRWYNGSATDGAIPPNFTTGQGWVNFAPPLSNGDYSIADLPADQYYLAGARLIFPFKDRLIFFGPVVQTSTAASQVYLPDTIIYSQNGTPYYTASFTGSATSATTTFNPILVPEDQTAAPNTFFEDISGYGGFLSAGISQPITTVSSNEDVLIVGFASQQSRLIYTGNDIVPFNFFTINSEYGSTSTFSSVNLDRGVVSVGEQGIVITSQVGAQRIDLDIPDQIFQFNLLNNGVERICSQRDFINEWIYFTYPSNEIEWDFPNQTLQYNYRDNSWALFNESYTTYGSFRRVSGETWATIGNQFPTWSSWNESWDSGSSTLFQPQVIAGNAQGFVMIRDDGTNEGNSLAIKNISFPSTITGATNANPCVLTASNNLVAGQTVTISGVGGMTQLNGNTYTVSAASSTTITLSVDSSAFGVYTTGGTATPPQVYSPDHCLNSDDFIVISGCLGTISSVVNGNIYSIEVVNENEFNIGISSTGTYTGGGVIKRMYIPMIKTKQFPVSWGMSRKTRIGAQQYLFSRTNNGQITLQIYLSQNADDPYNSSTIYPNPNSENDALVYTNILYTCPESTNLGLTSANINLNLVTAAKQSQIWHRMNTSLIGDTVQIGFTMSDSQMRDTTFSNQFAEIELHGFILEVTPSQLLA